VVLYCDVEANWASEGEGAGDGCIDPEKLNKKYEEISFIRTGDFSNDSSTVEFVRELASKNDSIRRKVLSEQQLSHLMMHKMQFLVNGVWLEHDVDESLFPIVSIRNLTENELEVLYLDCSLADINLQFLDLFDFTSSFVLYLYITEGICLIAWLPFGVTVFGCPTDFDDIVAIMFMISVGLSITSSILYLFSNFFAVYLNFFVNMILISWGLYL
jgi:hypothetical protein